MTTYVAPTSATSNFLRILDRTGTYWQANYPDSAFVLSGPSKHRNTCQQSNPSTSFLKNDSKLFAGCVRTLFDHCFVYWVALTPIIQSPTDSSVPTGDHAPSSRESDRPSTNLIPYPPAVGQQVDQIPLGHADLLAAKQHNTSRAWVSSQLTVVPVVLVHEAAFGCSS